MKYRLGFNPSDKKELSKYYDFVCDNLVKWKEYCKKKKVQKTKGTTDYSKRNSYQCVHSPKECLYKRFVIEERRLTAVSKLNDKGYPIKPTMLQIRKRPDEAMASWES